MDLFLYLPPLLSIYLLFVSGASTFYFKNKLSHFVDRKRRLKDHQQIIENVALDWSTRLSFFNSMFAAMVSALSIFSSTKDFVAFGVTLLALLVIFIPMGMWIHGHEIDELPSIMSRYFHIRHSTLCRLALYVVNFALILAIYYSRNYSAHLPT